MSAWLLGAAPIPRVQDTPQASRPSVLDAVYTSAQARRGQAQFEEHCAACHRSDLGGIAGPALKGDRFLDQWREFPLNVLVNDMRTQMPQRDGGLPRTFIPISPRTCSKRTGFPRASES
jgi:mono/diheme cytochrome c family protein